MSGSFVSELDHSSRGYVKHTQQQVEETSLESLERIRKQAEEMVAAWAGAIVQQQAPENADASLQGSDRKRMTPPAAPQKPANRCTFLRRVAQGDYRRLSPTAPPIESV